MAYRRGGGIAASRGGENNDINLAYHRKAWLAYVMSTSGGSYGGQVMAWQLINGGSGIIAMPAAAK